MLISLTVLGLAFISSCYGYTFSICGKDEFQCMDGKCISRSWRCDRGNDCADLSDEQYCEYTAASGIYYSSQGTCPSSYFRCTEYHCIPQAWVCDAVRDCSDGKDESECQPNYCGKPDMFTCKNSLCVPKRLICDGSNDCKDGSDEEECFTGILAVSGVGTSLSRGIAWLKSKRNSRWGWDEDTHRAIVALHLSGGASFNGTKKEEELMVKQLELKIALSLLRNDTNPISSNQLALYINAILVACHNPRNFYGFNLVQLLKNEILLKENGTHPIVYLALCNANETLSDDAIDSLFLLLEYESEYLFWMDIKAMAVIALSCITKQNQHAHLAQNVSSIAERFKRKQRNDGSFGNVYTSALVVQALLAIGHEEDSDWDVDGAVRYLQSKQSSADNYSFGDFLATYMILPILKAKSLTDIAHVKCASLRRQPRDVSDNLLVDVKNQPGPKIFVQYFLYKGNAKDVIHSLSLRIPVNITVYDVMRLASEADTKYKFKYRKIEEKIYVYSISNIANDPETGMFWLLHFSDATSKDKEPTLSSQSPDKIYVKGGEHIIMWYKTANIQT